MELNNILTDELTDIRAEARLDKDYRLSDEIRDELDTRGSYVFDHPEGQVVYHLGSGYTRDFVKANIRSIDQSFIDHKAFKPNL